MALPVTPPIEPMLAKLTEELPRGPGWLYEPKWDGFRALVFRDHDRLELISRDGRPINRYFPELVVPLEERLPPRCVVDGEIVIAADGRLDFDALLLRIHPAESRVELLARTTPSSFVAFDLLALADRDLRSTPLGERRSLLEDVLPDGRSGMPDRMAPRQIAITPQTDDPAEAEVWFDAFEDAGLDGVIAKHEDLLYRAGERAMVKVKHRRTADCVVAGYRLSKAGDGVGSLLLGLYDDGGVLHYVGHTSSFKAKERRELLELLRPLEGAGGFGRGRTPGGPSRWAAARSSNWTAVRPELVCEVAFDYLQGDRFRHATTFLRWRPEKRPDQCDFKQLGKLYRGPSSGRD